MPRTREESATREQHAHQRPAGARQHHPGQQQARRAAAARQQVDRAPRRRARRPPPRTARRRRRRRRSWRAAPRPPRRRRPRARKGPRAELRNRACSSTPARASRLADAEGGQQPRQAHLEQHAARGLIARRRPMPRARSRRPMPELPMSSAARNTTAASSARSTRMRHVSAPLLAAPALTRRTIRKVGAASLIEIVGKRHPRRRSCMRCVAARACGRLLDRTMSDVIDSEGFRANVGIVLMRGARRGISRAAHRGPGLAVSPGRHAPRARSSKRRCIRELHEEIGARRAHDVELVGQHRSAGCATACRRATCAATAAAVHRAEAALVPAARQGRDARFDFDRTSEPEFDQWRWVGLLGAGARGHLLQAPGVHARAHELAPLAFPRGKPPPFPAWWAEMPSRRRAGRRGPG